MTDSSKIRSLTCRGLELFEPPRGPCPALSLGESLISVAELHQRGTVAACDAGIPKHRSQKSGVLFHVD